MLKNCVYLNLCRPLRVRTKNIFFYFSTKTYVVGTQNNRLNETVPFSTQNIVKTGG